MALPTVGDGRTPEEGPENRKSAWPHPNRTSAGACLPPEATCPKPRRTLVVVALAALEVAGGTQGPTLPAFLRAPSASPNPRPHPSRPSAAREIGHPVKSPGPGKTPGKAGDGMGVVRGSGRSVKCAD